MKGLGFSALGLTLVLLLSVLVVPVAHAQPENAQAIKADVLLKIASEAMARAENAIGVAGDKAPDEAKYAFEAGVEALDEAKRLRDEGEYQEACRKAVEAMRNFILAKAAPEGVEPAKEEARRAIGLGVAIERAKAFIGRVEDRIEKAEEQGFEVSGIVEDKLSEARSKLGEYHKRLALGSLERAEDLLSRAKEQLEAGSIDRAKRAIEIAEGLVERAKEIVEEASEKPGSFKPNF